MHIRSTVIPLFLLALTSCSWFEPRGDPQYLATNKLTWLELDATRRSGYVIPQADGKIPVKILAEPAPDAALNKTVNFLIEGSAKDQNGKLKADLVETVSELSQQAETVKFLREALYRISELTINDAFTPETLKYFTVAVDASAALANARRERAAAEKTFNELGLKVAAMTLNLGDRRMELGKAKEELALAETAPDFSKFLSKPGGGYSVEAFSNPKNARKLILEFYRSRVSELHTNIEEEQRSLDVLRDLLKGHLAVRAEDAQK